MSSSFLTFLLLAPLASADAPRPEDRLFFEKSIRPLLHQHCLGCHSRSARKQRGGLLLDSRQAVLAGGDTGPAVVPGQPDKSLFLQAVRYDHATLHMPPAGKLPVRTIALFEEWIRRGAPYPGPAEKVARTGIDLAAGRKFWSFQPLRLQTLPSTPAPSRLDAFLRAAMQANGLAPSAPAGRRTLVRRVTFDLTGLPPTPEEIDAFLTDTRPDAYERLVDRLLASPAHGERFARFWLDLVRYCDVPESWLGLKGAPHLYRDWVVQALNDDVPYDRFVTLQLAADLLKDARPTDRAALGLLGLSPSYWKELKLDHNVIKGVVAEEWEERIHTLGSTFLGLTVACARCHDHKFDPVTTQDYYALAGVLASSRQADVSIGLDPRTKQPIQVPGVIEQSLVVLPDGTHRTKLEHRATAQDVAVQVRGNPASTGPIVPRRFLAVLSAQEPKPFRQGSGRLELAQAIVGEGGALAARVMVNRVWKQHFGEGLVRTPSDFGTQGERPTHPELLDDLAARFVAHGWSLRWLHREIVLSAAYRQVSGTGDGRDPDNRWLARMSRRKLEVEAWRDGMLAATGTLRRQMGGQALSLDNLSNDRRTLYGQVKRRELADILRLHDFPDPTTHSASRLPTTTPLQQLFVLNSPMLRHQAEALVRRLKTEIPGDEEGRIRRAYRLLHGREATAGEVRLGREYLAESPWEQYAQVLLASNEMLYVD